MAVWGKTDLYISCISPVYLHNGSGGVNFFLVVYSIFMSSLLKIDNG
jgi:hypothetical protein